jgi:hypothetical protein
MTKPRKLTSAQERKIIHTNWGYWDGVADHAHQRMAKWYRGAHTTYGHFNPDYATGYNIGIFGGEPPPYAVV